MPGLALVFLLFATIVATYGYSGKDSTSIYIAKMLFYVFIAIFIVILIACLFQTASPPSDRPNLPI